MRYSGDELRWQVVLPRLAVNDRAEGDFFLEEILLDLFGDVRNSLRSLNDGLRDLLRRLRGGLGDGGHRPLHLLAELRSVIAIEKPLLERPAGLELAHGHCLAAKFARLGPSTTC